MKIKARKSFSGIFEVAKDKSITHRAVMFASLSEGKSTIKKPLLGQDCLSTIECMRKLGCKIDILNDTIEVFGTNKFNDNVFLDCGNSGTTIRLLMGFLSGLGINVELTGDESLKKRPMKRVSEPLKQFGADIITNNGFCPVKISPAKLHSAVIQMQVASAQVKSAIILAALNAEGETVIKQKLQSRNHTELMLKSMGADIEFDNNRVTIKKSGNLKPVNITVPSDISSAAYFMALGALLGDVILKDVGINETRSGILKAFDLMKIRYKLFNKKYEGLEKVADIEVYKSEIKPANLTEEIMPSLIDELPIIAVLMCFADGKSQVSGAGELRVKESDRIKTIVEMLKNIGADIIENKDGFIINGNKTLNGGIIDSYDDHRIAMSGTVALMASKLGGEIKNAECVNISFPDFYKLTGNIE